ncbi:MAG TPA: hypothetical protein VE466_02690, partial [Acidimicrobiales bacterium]|nr:hypothetical protein [Acidimicrobiales bacterium]
GIGAVATWAGLIGAGLYWLRIGRKAPPPEAEAVAEAERLGQPGPEDEGPEDLEPEEAER